MITLRETASALLTVCNYGRSVCLLETLLAWGCFIGTDRLSIFTTISDMISIKSTLHIPVFKMILAIFLQLMHSLVIFIFLSVYSGILI